jgi:hypothetical protein
LLWFPKFIQAQTGNDPPSLAAGLSIAALAKIEALPRRLRGVEWASPRFSRGNRFIWPWGEEDLCAKQVRAEADGLRDWIEKKTAIRVDPKPIVVIPGWYVKERAIGAVRVTNQKMLASIVAQRRRSTVERGAGRSNSATTG